MATLVMASTSSTTSSVWARLGGEVVEVVEEMV